MSDGEINKVIYSEEKKYTPKNAGDINYLLRTKYSSNDSYHCFCNCCSTLEDISCPRKIPRSTNSSKECIMQYFPRPS